METQSQGSPVGRTVAERFEITRPIARGTMGCVYLATQHPLGRKVALKVLDVRGGESGSSFDARFTREAAVLAQLDHPSVVKIFDHGRDEDVFYLAMEYCDGPTLSALIKGQAPLDPVRAFSIVRQIAAGLHEAHTIGVVHRDLKPGNVIITGSAGRELPKVLDFGLVKTEDGIESTQPGMVLGTPNYMSPEQISGHKVDGRTDMYALGVILFLMLTGERPFKANTRTSVLSAHLARKPRSLTRIRPELPECVDWLVQRCMAKHPRDRFLDMAQFASALNACELAVTVPALSELQIGLAQGITSLPEVLIPCDGGFDGIVAAPVVLPPALSDRWIGGLIVLITGAGVVAGIFALVVLAALVVWLGKPDRVIVLPDPVPIEEPVPIEPVEPALVAPIEPDPVADQEPEPQPTEEPEPETSVSPRPQPARPVTPRPQPGGGRPLILER